jgi:hypothetical protein
LIYSSHQDIRYRDENEKITIQGGIFKQTIIYVMLS